MAWESVLQGILISSLLSHCSCFFDALRDESSLLQVKDKYDMISQAPCTTNGRSLPLLKALSNKSRRPEITTPLPVSVLMTSRLQQTSVPLLRYPYSKYLIDIVMKIRDGTESVTLPVQFDTGSSQFVVLGYNYCTKYYSGLCEPDAKNTFLNGTGWLGSVCSFDSSLVSLGDYGTQAFFGSIYKNDNFIQGCDQDLGIVGAGFSKPDGNILEQYPFFWTLTTANNLRPVLAVTACKFGTEVNGGRLHIGGTDPAYDNHHLEIVNVMPTEGYWAVYVDRLVIKVRGSISTDLDGSQLYGPQSVALQTIIDTGNDRGFSFIQSVYDQILEDIASSLDRMNQDYGSCITFDDLSLNMPIMRLSFQGGVSLQFQGEDWFSGPSITSLKAEPCILGGGLTGKEMVAALVSNGHLFVSQQSETESNNLGQGLLEVYYTEFRLTFPEIAFGPRVLCY